MILFCFHFQNVNFNCLNNNKTVNIANYYYDYYKNKFSKGLTGFAFFFSSLVGVFRGIWDGPLFCDFFLGLWNNSKEVSIFLNLKDDE